MVITQSINPRPLSALDLGLDNGSRVDTAGDNQSPNVTISNYQHTVSCKLLTAFDIYPNLERKTLILKHNPNQLFIDVYFVPGY